MARQEDKTNAMRLLDAAGLDYVFHAYETEEALPATEVAEILGVEPERLFKTLVTVGKSGEHYVFVIPGCSTLDLKKAASAVGEKSIEMIKSKELLPLTGYIHGGCSPIGMRKQFVTTVDETAILYDAIVVSAGRIGKQIELSLDALVEMLGCKLADLTC
ncbi:MAG: Cys-tRNA(Pro) deacylase [bacterium]|nr:Cys-tRNA(Pro) deacylase [bacterium]